MRWDLFCRVIDNHGDLGVCWRLARELAGRGKTVRLWVDEPAALAWMAPGVEVGVGGGAERGDVEVRLWSAQMPDVEPGDVVVEAFGCDPPPAYVARMAQRAASSQAPTVWVNLEYLSAEAYVERSHGLASPQMSGPGRGLTKWFFYPGFTPRTGGLLREPGLPAEREAFDRDAWLADRGWALRPGERAVSLFCYANPALPALLNALAATPTLLLATPGAAQRQIREVDRQQVLPPALRVIELPWLPHPDYDRLLWACDLNFVRGEDSFVRAQWAGGPFVWQIYPQDDGVHAVKLDAFMDRFLATDDDAGEATVAPALRALWRGWNGLAPWPAALPAPPGWHSSCLHWRDGLLAQTDLTSQLLRFVAERQ
jgi:uncharacterized repeat protein (TIGR03837 family)